MIAAPLRLRLDGAALTANWRALAAASGADRLIPRLCRFIVLVTGIALTILLTGNVVARYVMASGGIDAAQELPELLFPWFIVAGIALAAQAGGHAVGPQGGEQAAVVAAGEGALLLASDLSEGWRPP